MFYHNDRNKIRQFYYDVWHKYKMQQTLTALESQILTVILDHPEYHSLLNKAMTDQDFQETTNQMNPFMHMGLHLAIRDQVQLNQPQGIAQLFQQQLVKQLDKHVVEHQFMEVLGEHLWIATSMNKPLEMSAYLDALKKFNH